MENPHLNKIWFFMCDYHSCNTRWFVIIKMPPFIFLGVELPLGLSDY